MQRQLSRIPKKNYRGFQVRPYHAKAAIANFKKYVADDVSLVAPLSRFFCHLIAIRYEKHQRYVSDIANDVSLVAQLARILFC